MIKTGYLILLLVLTDAFMNSVMSDEIRFQTWSKEGVSRGTIREWGQDTKIEVWRPDGDIETTIIRRPPVIRDGRYIYERSFKGPRVDYGD